jgi:hypothetical protein
MNQYLLRIALLRAGYTPVPCRAGKPVIIPHGPVAESTILAWQNLEAPETGIYDPVTKQAVLVTEVPKSEAELNALRKPGDAPRAFLSGLCGFRPIVCCDPSLGWRPILVWRRITGVVRRV